MAVQVNNKAAAFANNQLRESTEGVWESFAIHWVNGEGEREGFKLLAVLLMGLEWLLWLRRLRGSHIQMLWV